MSAPNPFVSAISPELSAVIDAAVTMITNFGTDPAKLGLTAGPALGIFVNTVLLQAAPALNAEWGVAQADAIAKLQALKAKLPAPATAAPPA
jgi:hypothetical protein